MNDTPISSYIITNDYRMGSNMGGMKRIGTTLAPCDARRVVYLIERGRFESKAALVREAVHRLLEEERLASSFDPDGVLQTLRESLGIPQQGEKHA